MENLPCDSFEKKVVASLKIFDLTGLSSDAEFLRQLNHNLSHSQQPQPTFYQIWFNGVFNGLAAAAVGVVILVGLNVLPPLLVDASVTGTGLIQEKIVRATIDQRILWQQMVIGLEKFK
jgi:hypothetical protein